MSNGEGADATLFLVHWNTSEADLLAQSIRDHGWRVLIESEDGARAAERVIEAVPSVLVISLARLPSHGRQTAVYLRSKLDCEALPIVFFGGDPEKSAQINRSVPDTDLASEGELAEALERYRP